MYERVRILAALKCALIRVRARFKEKAVDRREGASACMLIHESQSFRKKSDSSYRYLTTPEFCLFMLDKDRVGLK